VVEVLGN